MACNVEKRSRLQRRSGLQITNTCALETLLLGGAAPSGVFSLTMDSILQPDPANLGFLFKGQAEPLTWD